MKNLVVLIEPSEKTNLISPKTGSMCLNRFCIDEETAFELSGVYYLKELPTRGIDIPKGNGYLRIQ